MPDNSVQKVLLDIVHQYGRSVCEDPQRCAALLRDLCPENRREVNVLVSALREGVAADLGRTSQSAPVEILIETLSNRLVSNLALKESAARWAVETWAVALGRIPEGQTTLASIDSSAPSPPQVIPSKTQRAPNPSSPPAGASDAKSAQIVTNPLGLELVPVPAGPFLYGDKKERISLPAFSIMKYPVTVRQYRMFCEAAGRAMPESPGWGWIDDHPIVMVTWHDASAFAQWVGGSLPTERQWEKAARGTDGRKYPWGNRFDNSKCVCSVGNKNFSSTAPVGSCPEGVSPYGCMDMAGNVWEWCADWYDNSHVNRVVRVGCWFDVDAVGFRAAYRGSRVPDSAYNNRGFRVVFQGSD
jgi:serine/threonine-protein kinase